MSDWQYDALTFANWIALYLVYKLRQATNKDGSWKDESRNRHT